MQEKLKQLGASSSFGDEQRDGAQSIRRSFQVLEVISNGPPHGSALSEVSARCGLPLPTIHRMLKALIGVGAVEQMARSKRYVIGTQLLTLGTTRPAPLRLIDLANPILLRASETVCPVAWLSSRSRLDAACLARMDDGTLQSPFVPVGSRRPLGMPAASLAMLAALDESEADALLERNCERLSRFDVSVTHARRQLQDAKRRKFTLRERGRITGMTTVSLAIRPFRGSGIAALTLGQTPDRCSSRWIDQAVQFLEKCQASLNFPPATDLSREVTR